MKKFYRSVEYDNDGQEYVIARHATEDLAFARARKHAEATRRPCAVEVGERARYAPGEIEWEQLEVVQPEPHAS